MEYQQTIKKEISLEGVGLHTGNSVKVTFVPAQADTGIQFVRVDLDGQPVVKAEVESILEESRMPRRTSIGKNGFEIHTIEHLMAALHGLAIDNIRVEIDNNEAPGLDGSGLAYVEALKKAGLDRQESVRGSFVVREPVWAQDNDSSLAVLPYHSFRISYTLSYDHPVLRSQYLDIEIDPATFEKEIASFRTFCLEDEVAGLKGLGLGKGANYQNTLVVSKDSILENELRKEDEFARHKVLDLIGDFYLLGVPLKGHVIALKSGHALNLRVINKIAQQKKRFEAGGIASTYVHKGTEMDISTIMKVLPHRYPFLLVDRILSIEEGKRAVGIKNVSMNEHFFTGHFPVRPVMPGVLMIEAMAQVGGVLMLSQEKHLGKIAYFIAANNVKFRKPVVPGDQLVLEVEVIKVRSRVGQVHTQAKVDDKVVAEADLMFTLTD
ncbi:bifunctional UDP-3-O-[3-hydroxymyristoyl] N-acetylglucosamine deacetylase/3-hydroxyacyl-ACP dehydratase [Candidatus Omnitrophota bacterium]